MYFGLPIITHPSNVYNGQLEVIDGNGFIAHNCDEYAQKMKLLQQDKKAYLSCAKKSREMFSRKYDSDVQIQNLMNIFDDVLCNPYPHKIRRVLFSIINKEYVIVKKLIGMFPEGGLNG